MLEKNEENHLDRSFEKLSVTKSQGGQGYPTYNEIKEG
jgi:hypothetical protein